MRLTRGCYSNHIIGQFEEIPSPEQATRLPTGYQILGHFNTLRLLRQNRGSTLSNKEKNAINPLRQTVTRVMLIWIKASLVPISVRGIEKHFTAKILKEHENLRKMSKDRLETRAVQKRIELFNEQLGEVMNTWSGEFVHKSTISEDRAFLQSQLASKGAVGQMEDLDATVYFNK